MNGIELIAKERQRQIDVEGYLPEQDNSYVDGELSLAAATYAIRDEMLWPWPSEYFKPSPDNRVRELVKAGALIAAEIDRLQRLEESK